MPASPPVAFLYDNGSFRPESTLVLRRLATQLAPLLPGPVHAVSLLHSTRVPADQLEDQPARLLEPALTSFFESQPDAHAVLLPLFFGPSGALVDYVPERVASLRAKFPAARIDQAACLIDLATEDGAAEITAILADRVRSTLATAALSRPPVALVDHGTPLPAVSAVRDLLGRHLAASLADNVSQVAVCSMERRPGDAYAFNEPLLESLLQTPPFNHGDVIIALQFLSPGRHAGPGGDVATICEEACHHRPALRPHLTATLDADPRLAPLLARRYHAAVA